MGGRMVNKVFNFYSKLKEDEKALMVVMLIFFICSVITGVLV